MESSRSKPSIGGRFQSLVDHIYGPYPDHIFLEEALKPKPAQDGYLDLHCVTLYAGKKPIGLDQSEYLIKPSITSFVHEDHRKHVPVSFCGMLEIRDLAWLSKKGRSFLERDVRNLDKVIVPHNTDRREVTLEQVLNSARGGQCFRIYLLCRKRHLAHYLTSKSPTRQHQLLIYSGSADGLVNRKFAVKSLHVESYVASKTFLARYRLRALLVELSEIDDQTPIHCKDYSWVVNSYVAHILPRDMEDERRRKLRPTAELSPYSDDLRYPRHVPLSQVQSELAEHSEWILANQIGKKGGTRDVPKGLVYIPAWVDWINEAYTSSLEAKKKGIKWGLSESLDLKDVKRSSLEHRLARFGETSEFWKSRLQSWIKCSKRYVEEDRDKPVLSTRGVQPVPPAAYGGFDYDSDFSPDYTTSAWSDSDDSDFFELSGPLKGVFFCSQPPHIPLGHFVWHCPGQDCHKAINLLELSPEDAVLLPQNLAHNLQKKRWRTQDVPVQQALAVMVSHHYHHEHLAPAGLHQVSTKHGLRFQLLKALRKANPRKRAHSLEIKEENSS